MMHFTQKMCALAACTCCLTLASAQTALPVGRRALPAAASTSPFRVQGKGLKLVQARVVKTPTDYGKECTLVSEDFSKFTNGSIEQPATSEKINYNNPDNAWINMSNEYTHTPGWGSHSAYPAGGCIYLKADKRNQAQLNTPMINAADHQGIVFLQFRARTAKEGDVAFNSIVEAAETYNMSPSWDMLGSTVVPEITSEWQTYEFMYYGAGSYTLFNIVVNDTPVVIDDVKVYQIDQYTDTPTAHTHRYYHGEDFNLYWNKVKGADSYLLDVYTADEVGDVDTYLLKDAVVTDTTHTVTGATSGEVYYYTVRSAKGEHESMPTAPIQILDVAAPTLHAVTEHTDGTFTASWDAVPAAERYNYISYYKRKATQSGEFVVTDLNFDGVRAPVDAPNDTLTKWTIDEPSFNTWSEAYIDRMSQAGWKGTNYAPYTDYICLDGYHYIYGHTDSGLTSPELDLSKDGGKMKLSVDLYGAAFDDGMGGGGYTQCAVALFNYNEEKDDYEQVELVYPQGVKAKWQTFEVELTKGSKRSIVGLFAVSQPENLYIDNLKITQNYQAGDELLDPFFFRRWLEDTSVKVLLSQKQHEQELFHRVNAERVASNDGYNVKRKVGSWSTLESAGKGTCTSVRNATASYAAAQVKVEQGHVCVSNPTGAAVQVFATNGAQVFADASGAASITTPTLPHGTYVVKVGTQSVKVTF